MTPWSRVLEKSAALQLLKKFAALYGNGKPFTAFITAHHLFLS
jgi:hypothetical protein